MRAAPPPRTRPQWRVSFGALTCDTKHPGLKFQQYRVDAFERLLLSFCFVIPYDGFFFTVYKYGKKKCVPEYVVIPPVFHRCVCELVSSLQCSTACLQNCLPPHCSITVHGKLRLLGTLPPLYLKMSSLHGVVSTEDQTYRRCPVSAWIWVRCLEGVRKCDGYAV